MGVKRLRKKNKSKYLGYHIIKKKTNLNIVMTIWLQYHLRKTEKGKTGLIFVK